MKVAFIAVGTELLGTERLDTNSLRLTRLLHRYGLELGLKLVVGDDEAALADLLRWLAPTTSLVVISGGLGPTTDDVTRGAVATALGRSLHFDPTIAASIEARFALMGRQMPEVNRRQAEVIDGARVIPNRRGTAPGLELEHGACTLMLLPGVPRELEAMLDQHVAPWLAAHTDGRGRHMGVIKVACLPESEVEQRIAPAYAELGKENVTVLAKPGEITIQHWATGTEAECRQQLEAQRQRLAELVGKAAFAFRAEDSLESVVGALLAQRGATVGVAESCTGGLVAERLTRVPGSSAYFLGAVVPYANRVKSQLAGIPELVVASHGAVSEPVARALAGAACELLGSDYGIGITGIAGPGGGSEDKPVGTVHIAVAGPDDAGGGERVRHRRVQLIGDRERIRWQSSQIALDLLRRRLLRGGANGVEAVAAGHGSETPETSEAFT